MTTVAANLRTTFLTAGSAGAALKNRIGDRIAQDSIPQGWERPFLFLQRTGIRQERCLDEAQGQVPFSQTFSVEAVADEPTTADEVADLVRGFDLYTGTFGSSTCRRIFVNDQQADYEPINAGGDDGRHVTVLSVEVVL